MATSSPIPDAAPVAPQLHAEGATMRQMAATPDDRGIRAPAGGTFSAPQVQRPLQPANGGTRRADGHREQGEAERFRVPEDERVPFSRSGAPARYSASDFRLGKVSERIAEEVSVKAEPLVAAAAAGVSWDAAARWAAGLAPELSEKLAEVGLIPLRQERAGAALGTFLDAYLTR